MRNRLRWMGVGMLAVAAVLTNIGFAQDDPGKTNMGRVAVTVYYATDGDPKVALSSTVGSEAWNSRDLKSRPH